MKKGSVLLIAICLIIVSFCSFILKSGRPYGCTTESRSPWPELKKEMRPWTRWWWMGSAVDKKNLDNVLEIYNKAGFGGVEITPIYGAIGFESRYINFLSPLWMSMLNFTVSKASSLGMGVDMNTGTGWPFGGPQVTSEDAASKLVIQSNPTLVKQNRDLKIQLISGLFTNLIIRLNDTLSQSVTTIPERNSPTISPLPNDGSVSPVVRGRWRVLRIRAETSTGTWPHRAADGFQF